MTTKEAIEILKAESYCLNPMLSEEWGDAMDMAVAALCAQQPRTLDRSRWKGCQECNNIVINRKMLNLGRNYCPRCGRPLTEEAWAEPEQRIGGNDGTADIL